MIKILLEAGADPSVASSPARIGRVGSLLGRWETTRQCQDSTGGVGVPRAVDSAFCIECHP